MNFWISNGEYVHSKFFFNWSGCWTWSQLSGHVDITFPSLNMKIRSRFLPMIILPRVCNKALSIGICLTLLLSVMLVSLNCLMLIFFVISIKAWVWFNKVWTSTEFWMSSSVNWCSVLLLSLISASLSDISIALFSEELVGVSNSIVLAGSDVMIPDSALGRLVTYLLSGLSVLSAASMSLS